MKQIFALALLALALPASATITITKSVVVQAPVYVQDDTGILTVDLWTDVKAWVFTDAATKADAIALANPKARRRGGQVIVRTLTVDDKGSLDTTTWDTTTADRIVTVRPITAVTFTLPRDQALMLLDVLAGRGEKWADLCAATLRTALGLA